MAITLKQAKKMNLYPITKFLDPSSKFLTGTVINQTACRKNLDERKVANHISVVSDERFEQLKEKYDGYRNKDWFERLLKEFGGGFLVKDGVKRAFFFNLNADRRESIGRNKA